MHAKHNGKNGNGYPIQVVGIQFDGSVTPRAAYMLAERSFEIARRRLRPGAGRIDVALESALGWCDVAGVRSSAFCDDAEFAQIARAGRVRQVIACARELLRAPSIAAAPTAVICQLLYHLDSAGASLSEIMTGTAARELVEKMIARYEAQGLLALARLTVKERLPNAKSGAVNEEIKEMYECLSRAGLKPEDIGTNFGEIKRLLRDGQIAVARWWFQHATRPLCDENGNMSDPFESVRQMFSWLKQAKATLADIPTTDATLARLLQQFLDAEKVKQ